MKDHRITALAAPVSGALETKVLKQRSWVSPTKVEARNKRDVNGLSDRTEFRNTDRNGIVTLSTVVFFSCML